MAKRNDRTWAGAVVPDDWDGQEYCYILVCIPKSTAWVATALGAIDMLAWPSFWRYDGGSVYDAVKVAKSIRYCVMCNLEEIITEQNTLLKYLIAHLDANGAIRASYPLPNPQVETEIHLRDLDIEPVFSTNNLAYPDEGLADLLAKIGIADIWPSWPGAGSTIADLMYSTDNTLTRAYQWATSDWFNLMNWFASSFRGGIYSDVNPFSYETFFSRFAGAFTTREYISTTVPIWKPKTEWFDWLPDWLPGWPLPDSVTISIPSPNYSSKFEHDSKSVTQIIKDKKMTSNQSIDNALFNRLIDAVDNLQLAGRADAETIARAISCMEVVAIANTGNDVVINTREERENVSSS